MALVLQGYFQLGFPRFVPQGLTVQRRVGPHLASAQPQRIGNAVQLPPELSVSPPGQGTPLPAAVRHQMESFFAADFSGVRIHVGVQPAAIGALAFTIGQDIHFAPGQYDPNTSHGKQLLGHELAHVLQQRAGRVRNPFGSGVAVVQDPAMEAEAERLGLRAAASPVQAKAAPHTRLAPPNGAASPQHSSRLIVNDYESPGPGQARKTEFLSSLRKSVVQNADNVLSKIGQTSADCPYIPYWFNLYNQKSPAHIERALQRYAPGSARAVTWRDFVGVVSMKVDEGFRSHVASGSLAGVPLDLPYLEPGRPAQRVAQARLRPSVAQLCCWLKEKKTNYTELEQINTLPSWGGAVHLGYHGTKHWKEIQSSGEFRPGGGKLGPGIYVGGVGLTRTYSNLSGGEGVVLEVGYVGDQSGWQVHQLRSLSEYDESLEGQYDVLLYENAVLGQTCYKLNGPSNISAANFRVRLAD